MAETQTLAAPQDFGSEQETQTTTESQVPADIAGNSSSASRGNLPAARPGQSAGNSVFPSVREILAQPLVRRSLPPILGLFTIIFFIGIYFWANEGNMRALYPSMTEVDRSEAYEQLLATDIGVTLDSSSGTLMVPTERYYEARMLLASAGLPANSNTQAMDTFSSASSMTTSQFIEQAQYTSAIEAELSKSIVQISSIQ